MAFVGLFFPFHDPWGLSWGSSHVSTPQRSISSRQAEGLYRRALEGGESQLGAQHPDTLVWVHNLADLLYKQGKLEEARLRFLGYTEVAERLVRVSFLASHFHLGLNL